MQKLLILLTNSKNDYEIIASKVTRATTAKDQNALDDIIFIDCQNEQPWSIECVDSPRLLSVVRLHPVDPNMLTHEQIEKQDRQKNLENLTQAMRACRNGAAVLGVHYDQPDKLLDLSKLPLPSVPYSAGGSSEFAFVSLWFNEMTKDNCNMVAVRAYFDEMWKLLDIPHRMEWYLDTVLCLSLLQDQEDSKERVTKLSEELTKKLTIPKQMQEKVRTWDVKQRDTVAKEPKSNIEVLNEEFFNFAAKEFIERYPYLKDVE